jgi:hypothetical protein
MTCKGRGFAFVACCWLLLNGSTIYSQPRHQIALFSHWSQYFEQQQTYSFPVIPRITPGVSYSYYVKPAKNFHVHFGADVQFTPLISQVKFSISDPALNIPSEVPSDQMLHFMNYQAFNMGVHAGINYRPKKSPHSFSFSTAISTTFPESEATGMSFSVSSPDPLQRPFIISSQFYTFRPDGLLAVRLQAGYQYHFNLLKQPFFALARVDYQLNNRPEVLFRVVNDQDAVVASFTHTFPRFYGFLGLGWCWGKKK